MLTSRPETFSDGPMDEALVTPEANKSDLLSWLALALRGAPLWSEQHYWPHTISRLVDTAVKLNSSKPVRSSAISSAAIAPL